MKKTHISFEICEDNLNDKTYFNKVYKEAVGLAAYLCKPYKLTEKKIIGHYEDYQKKLLVVMVTHVIGCKNMVSR